MPPVCARCEQFNQGAKYSISSVSGVTKGGLGGSGPWAPCFEGVKGHPCCCSAVSSPAHPSWVFGEVVDHSEQLTAFLQGKKRVGYLEQYATVPSACIPEIIGGDVIASLQLLLGHAPP